MNNRIRELRKNLGLTLAEFSVNLGVGNAAISKIERGDRGVSEQIILNILKTSWNGKYVSEAWLRTGDGDMFVTLPEEDAYFKAATLLQDNPSIVALVTEYYNSSDEFKREFEDFLDRVIETRRRLKDEESEN